MLKAALVGFGGIAQAVYIPAFQALAQKGKARLIAACDINPAQFTKMQTINIGSGGGMPPDCHTYTSLDDMLAHEEFDLPVICLPTYLHAPVAVTLLNRGYHVLSEKPMALTYAACLEMLSAAKAAGRLLMIGQCLRFAPEYIFLKQAIESGTYGKPVSAALRRLGGPPLWGWDNWFMDAARSGGCILDFHVHDIDIARFLFGEPSAVSCVTGDIYSRDDIVHTRLMYDGTAVLVVGDWSQEGTGFAADYRVGFEKATVVCEGGSVTVYPRGGEPEVRVLSGDNMSQNQLEYFCDLITSGDPNVVSPPESAAATVGLIERLRESARHGGKSCRLTSGVKPR